MPLFSPLLGGAAPDPLAVLGWPLAAFVAAIALAFVAEMARYQGPGGVIVNVALAVFTVAYVAVLMTFLTALRLYHDNGWGMAAVASLIFVTKMSDTGAYAFGRLFGRHKMAPVLSPKKTIEGGIGGLVTACFCSWLFFATLLPIIAGPHAQPPPLWACLVYGTVVAVAGVIGDLSESLLKRDMERKDSSRWMPGLGGSWMCWTRCCWPHPPAISAGLAACWGRRERRGVHRLAIWWGSWEVRGRGGNGVLAAVRRAELPLSVPPS